MAPAKHATTNPDTILMLDALKALERALNLRITDSIESAEKQRNDLFSRLHSVEVHGCAHFPSHADQELRIRILESVAQRKAGAAVAIGAASGFLAAILIPLGKLAIGMFVRTHGATVQ